VIDSTGWCGEHAQEDAWDQFAACREGLEDPRNGNAGWHDVHERLSGPRGGHGATDRAAFAATNEPFARSFRRLEQGGPSHDRFRRRFRHRDPEPFRGGFQRIVGRFAEACQGVVVVDRRVLRRSFDTAGS